MAFGNNTSSGVPPYENKDFYNGLSNLAGGIFSQSQYKNPADDSMKYLQGLPPQILQYLLPYINAGNKATGESGDAYSNLVTNPSSVYNSIASNYKQSPGYQFNVDQSTKAAANAAAAGGMAGSPQHQQQLASVIAGLSSQDFNNYLQNVLGQYDIGLQGLGNLSKTGAETAENYGTDLGNIGLAEAMTQYAGRQNQNQQNSGFGAQLASALKSLAGSFF